MRLGECKQNPARNAEGKNRTANDVSCSWYVEIIHKQNQLQEKKNRPPIKVKYLCAINVHLL